MDILLKKQSELKEAKKIVKMRQLICKLYSIDVTKFRSTDTMKMNKMQFIYNLGVI